MCHSWEHEACDRVEVRIQMIQLIHVKSHLPLFLQAAVNIIQMILQQHKGAAGIMRFTENTSQFLLRLESFHN